MREPCDGSISGQCTALRQTADTVAHGQHRRAATHQPVSASACQQSDRWRPWQRQWRTHSLTFLLRSRWIVLFCVCDVCSELSSGSQVMCRVEGRMTMGVLLHPPTGRASRKSTGHVVIARREQSSGRNKHSHSSACTATVIRSTSTARSSGATARSACSNRSERAFAGFSCSLLAYYGQTGSRKCFAEDVALMRADGSFVPAQHVREGDQLMGDGGTLRPLLHGTLVQRKASLVPIMSHDDACRESRRAYPHAARGTHRHAGRARFDARH